MTEVAPSVARVRCAALATIMIAASPSAPGAQDHARFVVEDRVVNAAVAPFTATVGAIGAGARLVWFDGGFEPVVYRDAILTTATAPDRIIADPRALSLHHTLREGALDGADVAIYRIEHGAFRLVRRDRVAHDGHAASDWRLAAPDNVMVAADVTHFNHVFDPGHRPNAPIWLAVRSVGADGALSAPSAAVMARSPQRGVRRPQAAAVLVPRPHAGDGAGQNLTPPPPQGVTARTTRNGVAVTWRAAQGVAGYQVMVSETPPDQHRGHFLALEGDGPPVTVGSLAIVSKRFVDAMPTLRADRVWNAPRAAHLFKPRLLDFWSEGDPGRRWTLTPHEAGSPVTNAGETHLRLTLARNAQAAVGLTAYGGRAQDWYALLQPRPYRISVWLRADRPITVVFRLTGPLADAVRPIVFAVGVDWRRFEAEFTPPSPPATRQVGRMELVFEGPATVDVDNFNVHRADVAFLDLPPEDYARLADSGMGALRTHALVKTGRKTYDLAQLTNAGGAISAGRGRNTLPQTLGIVARAGLTPWLQVEPHFSPEEWLGLVEYLAAPFDPDRHDTAQRPWAAKRHAQGRAAPWTDAFDSILFEIGNETWSRAMRPWTFPPMRDAATGRRHSRGAVYGMVFEHVIQTMRASPYWAAAGLDGKMRFVIGGHRRTPTYGRDASRTALSADLTTVAAYVGGWDEAAPTPTATPETFHALLTHAPVVAAPSARALALEARATAAARGRPFGFGTYEGGPGYVLDGLNGARVSPEEAQTQERVMKSKAAGVATLDSFLSYAEAGAATQNYFTFNAGDRWTSHAEWTQGGHAYPGWLLLSLFNTVGTGDMLLTRTLQAPRADLPARRRDPAAPDTPMVAAYATRRGDQITLTLISRRLPGWPNPADDGYTSVRVALPIESASRLTLYRLTGAHDDHNVVTDTVRLTQTTLPTPTDPSDFVIDAAAGMDQRGLPPATALIYVFEGVTAP